MSHHLSAEALSDLRRCINKSLSDIFQMMFRLDVFLLPKTHLRNDDKNISAYIELNEAEAQGLLSITMTKALAEYLAVQLTPNVTPPSDAVIQDIACEIINIIGNHVRSYIQDKMDVNYVIGLPKHGLPPKDPKVFHLINLHFRIREDDSIYLGMDLIRRADSPTKSRMSA